MCFDLESSDVYSAILQWLLSCNWKHPVCFEFTQFCTPKVKSATNRTLHSDIVLYPLWYPLSGNAKFAAKILLQNWWWWTRFDFTLLDFNRISSDLTQCCNYCWHGSQNKSGLINSIKCTIPRTNSNLFFVELFLIQPKCPFFVRNREINTST